MVYIGELKTRCGCTRKIQISAKDHPPPVVFIPFDTERPEFYWHGDGTPNLRNRGRFFTWEATTPPYTVHYREGL